MFYGASVDMAKPAQFLRQSLTIIGSPDAPNDRSFVAHTLSLDVATDTPVVPLPTTPKHDWQKMRIIRKQFAKLRHNAKWISCTRSFLGNPTWV